MVWVLMACVQREPYYPPEDTDPPVPDSAAPGTTDDTGRAEPSPYPWDDDAFWGEPGPFAPLLDLSLTPTAPHWEVWMFTSPDAAAWDGGTRIAHSFSSLDLLVLEQGVILGGSTITNEGMGVYAPFENFFALVSADLKTWGSHLLPIQEATHRQIVDPSLHVDPDGEVRMVWYAAPDDVDPTKNPEEYKGDHPICTATWGEDGLVQHPDPLLSAPALVDPSGCAWQGEHHILATGESQLYSMNAASVGGDYGAHPPQHWGGVQVPYCFVEEDKQWILVQAGGGFGPPVAITRGPGEAFSEPFAVIPEDEMPFNNCTSPVMGRFQGQYVLFCAVWQ